MTEQSEEQYFYFFPDKIHSKKNEIEEIMRSTALQSAIHAAGINLGWSFKCILNLKWPALKQIMQMLEVFLTCLPVHSSQPVRPSLGPLIDCFVPSRYGVTATLGEMAQNASPKVKWGLRLPEDLRVSALLSFPCCWHPCSLAELRWDTSAGERRKTQDAL